MSSLCVAVTFIVSYFPLLRYWLARGGTTFTLNPNFKHTCPFDQDYIIIAGRKRTKT